MPSVEEQIRSAIAEGKFDNLPGKGKPLNLDDYPFEDPEWELANHMLKSSGFSLPWIEKRVEIEALITSARNSLKLTYEWRAQTLKDDPGASFVMAKWNEAVRIFREQAAEINRLILTYNLEVPCEQLHRQQLSIERELDLTSSSPSDTLPN